LQFHIAVARDIGDRRVQSDWLPAAGVDEQELLFDPDSRQIAEISV
jgi:hypothetical protein